jgi:RNA polymerase sigma-70 factor, ECF subfamily
MPPNSDHDTWRKCFEQLAPKLLLYARQWVESPADAEDVVQSAFVRFWQRKPDAQREDYPLLYTAVRTAALDLRRKNQRRIRREMNHQEKEISAGPFFENAFERREEAALLSAALGRLPDPQREAVVLRIWGELTFAEIAQVLGESMNTVAGRYRAALAALRETLKTPEYESV